MVPRVMPTASRATDQPLARAEQRAEDQAQHRMSRGLPVDPVRVGGDEHDQQRALRRGQDPGRADEHQPVWHRDLEPDGDRGGDRDGPAQLALGPAAPRGQRGALVHRPGGLVQPLARVHALRLKALRDQAVELVDPAVQRPDPVDDLGRRYRQQAAPGVLHRHSCQPRDQTYEGQT